MLNAKAILIFFMPHSRYKLDLMLCNDKIKFRIDQATKLLAMKAVYNTYNVPGVLL
jgi:hypothetical protein